MSIAAYIFCALALLGAGFMACLAAGAPWGELTMGGRFSGRLPAAARLAAVVQGAMLVGLALLVLDAAGVLALDLPAWTRFIPFGVSLVSLVMNVITPSKRERMLWAPVALGMSLSSAYVAF